MSSHYIYLHSIKHIMRYDPETIIAWVMEAWSPFMYNLIFVERKNSQVERFLIIKQDKHRFWSIVVLYIGYCSSVIIDENQLSSTHNILSTTKLKIKKNKNKPPPPSAVVDQKLAPISAQGIVTLLPANCRDSSNPIFVQKSCNIKIAKKKVRIKSPLVNPIIDLQRPFEKMLEKGKYTVIKFHNTPGNNDSRSYEINLFYYGGGSPEEWLIWKDRLLKNLARWPKHQYRTVKVHVHWRASN